MSRRYGVVPAKVESETPDEIGRVKLCYQIASGEGIETDWAPIATFMSGKERGSWFMPEKGDDVLLAFENGNPDRPYVIGFLWNGEDKPPAEDGIDRQVRRLRTVKKHELEFNDTDGEEKISLRFQGETPAVDLEETKATITMPGDHKIVFDDGGSILIEFNSTNKIEMTNDGITITGSKVTIDGSGGIDITSSGGEVKVEGSSGVDITSTGEVKVEGSLIKLN